MAKTKRKTQASKKSKRVAKKQFGFVDWLMYSPLIVGEVLVLAAVYAGMHEGVGLGVSFIQFTVGTVFIWAVFTWIASHKQRV